MNHDRLASILEQYVQRFDELNDYTGNDEGYKWRAETWFKQNWDIEDHNFPAMFKLAMKETSNLIDNATVQPIGGILELLKHDEEIEFVRACFRELFSDDNGNLKNRQNRIEDFTEKINAHLEKYVAGSWKYPQKVNNVIYYLNLWKPDENYIFKSTEATAWADCIEYGDDFGSGSTFSLEKYYAMCDELLAELSQYSELMKLHHKRFLTEANGFDDNLHILVYDIIYCAHAYNFYAKMDIPKLATKERIRVAKLHQEKEKLSLHILEKEKQIQALDNSVTILPDLTNHSLNHKIFGKGIVISCTENMLSIDFSGQLKKFQYPDAIAKGFLICTSDDILDQIHLIAEQREKRATLEKELKSLKAALSKL